MLKRDEGSAAIESIFAMIVIMILVLGAIQITFALYARNVVMASAHEGARAAIEQGRSAGEAKAIALATVERSTGRLVKDLHVEVVTHTVGTREIVTVFVKGRAQSLGPVPFPLAITARSTSTRESSVP